MEILGVGLVVGVIVILVWGAALTVGDKERAYKQRRAEMELKKGLKKNEKL